MNHPRDSTLPLELVELLLDHGAVVNIPNKSHDKSQLYHATKKILNRNYLFFEKYDFIKKDKKLFHKIVSEAVKTGKIEIYNHAELVFNWWREKKYSIDSISELLNSPDIIATKTNNLLNLEHLCLMRILTLASGQNREDKWVALCENNSVLPRHFKVNLEMVKHNDYLFKLIENIKKFAITNKVYDLPQIGFNFSLQKASSVVKENSRLNTAST